MTTQKSFPNGHSAGRSTVNLSRLLVSVAALGALTCGIANADTMPETGTYFVTNMKSEEALQPVGPTMGQNVLLYPADQSGAQKWIFTRIIDPKTKKPTNQYTIHNISDDNLNLELPPMANMGCHLGPSAYKYTLAAGPDGITIKQKNGDCLFMYSQPPLKAEAHFGPDDASPKCRWKLTSTN